MKKVWLAAFLICAGLSGIYAQDYSRTWRMNKWKSPDSYGNVVPVGFRLASIKGCYFFKSEEGGGRGDSGYAIKIDNKERDQNNRLVSPPLDFFKSGEGTYTCTFYTKGTGRLAWVNLTTNVSSIKDAVLLSESAKQLQSSDWTRHDYTFKVSDPSVKYYLFFLIHRTDPSDPVLFDDLTVKKKAKK